MESEYVDILENRCPGAAGGTKTDCGRYERGGGFDALDEPTSLVSSVGRVPALVSDMAMLSKSGKMAGN